MRDYGKTIELCLKIVKTKGAREFKKEKKINTKKKS
jgi:hypothetical protein